MKLFTFEAAFTMRSSVSTRGEGSDRHEYLLDRGALTSFNLSLGSLVQQASKQQAGAVESLPRAVSGGSIGASAMVDHQDSGTHFPSYGCNPERCKQDENKRRGLKSRSAIWAGEEAWGRLSFASLPGRQRHF